MTPSQTRMAPFSSYVALVRGVLVDLGLGSLFDKFEERFGRKVSTGLLAIAGIAIVAGAIGLISNQIIQPGIALYQSADWPGFKVWVVEHLLPTVVSLGILYILGLLLYFVGTELYRRTLAKRRMRKTADAFVEKALTEYEEKIRAGMERISEKAETEASTHFSDMKTRLMREFYSAMEHRDAALSVSKEILDLIQSWISELDEAKPEESVEKSRRMIQMLQKLRRDAIAQTEEPPLPTMPPKDSTK